MIDKSKVRHKIQFMRDSLKKLDELSKFSREEFLADYILIDAATRVLQVTVEAVLDICAHVISREGLGLPKNYGDAVTLAVRHELIPQSMEKEFKSMVRFRNRVVHLYDDVSPEEIYQIIQEHRDDFKPFLENVVARYFDDEEKN